MPDEKTLPKDWDSDDSLPGRFEESNPNYFAESVDTPKPKPNYKTAIIIATVFVIVSAGIFSYYFVNQDEIDSQIIQNAYNPDPERDLVAKYGVGEYGSDHAHAAIVVFVEDERINFGLQQFQLTSKYIHFENHNPYLIHKHATGVPLEMLFSSFGVKITSDCIVLNAQLTDLIAGRYCSDDDKSLVFFVNGVEFTDISEYEISHNDRILISYGNSASIPAKLAFLDSLQIPEPPKKTPQSSGNEINV